MKRYVKWVLTLLLLPAVILGSVFMLISCNDKEEPITDKGEPMVKFVKAEGELPYLTKTYADGSDFEDGFKIVTFSDPHFNGDKTSAGDAVSLKIIENTLRLEKPDLVVLLGDNCVGENAAEAIKNLGDLFEQYNTYWGYVLGNHDGENAKGPARSELPALYGAYEHCVVDSVSGISGEGNCIVNIKNTNGKVIHSLVFLDAGDYLTPENCDSHGFEYKSSERTQYDFIKFDQIEWYKSTMREIADKNGEMPASIMFTHIPLIEYSVAYFEADKSDTIVHGSRWEIECSPPPGYNTGMFDAILEIGSTKAVICGHDHTNDYCVDYQGVKLMYSQTTAYNSYLRRSDPLMWLLYQKGEQPYNDGHTEFLIDLNGNMTTAPRYNQDNPSLFDGISDEHRKEVFIDITLPKQD